MRLIHTVALGLLALSTVVNAADLNNHVQHEFLANIPRGWSLLSTAPVDDIHLTYRIAVKQNSAGVKQLERYLLDHSSNPASDRYGHHLTRAEINSMVKPHQASVDSVVDWLNQHGITDEQLVHTDGSDFISFTAPVSVGNKLLNTQYNVYKHGVTGHQVVRTQSYHLPAHLTDHVDFVSPTTRFPHAAGKAPVISSVDKTGKYHPLNKHKLQSAGGFGANPFIKAAPAGLTLPAATAPASLTGAVSALGTVAVGVACNQFVTPKCIRTLYETDSYKPTSTATNKLGVTGYLGQYWSLENLKAAVASFTVPYFGLAALSDTPTTYGDNPQGENNAGAEADLDIQTTVQNAYPTPVTFYSTPGLQPYTDPNTNAGPAASMNEPYSDWLATVLGQPDVPQVITTSYGDNEDTVGYNYAQRVCDEFMELGAQGVSVLFSSGDGGVAGGQAGACGGANQDLFVPTYPAACPYVTSVGATALNPDGTESATYDPTISTYASSGGFSNYFPRPAYQDAAVAAWKAQQGSTYEGLYNASGRGIPDVSALGAQFAVYLSPTGLTGEPLPTGTDVVPIVFRIDGTSAASPAFASVIALVNDYRMSMGKGPVGFLNAAIYAQPTTGWNDITTGTNGCSGSCGCGTNGFSAVQGWDPLTGLGSPRFTALSAYLASLGVPAPDYNQTPFPASAFTPSPA